MTTTDSINHPTHAKHPSAIELYEVYRKYIEHEDELIHQRSTALVTIQSFTIATFGLSYKTRYEVAAKIAEPKCVQTGSVGTQQPDSKVEKSFESVSDEFTAFMFLLIFIGLATSAVAFSSIRAAVRAIRRLKSDWECFLKRTDDQITKNLPGITGGGDSRASNSGDKLALWAPKLSMAVWLTVLFAMVFLFKVRFNFHL